MIIFGQGKFYFLQFKRNYFLYFGKKSIKQIEIHKPSQHDEPIVMVKRSQAVLLVQQPSSDRIARNDVEWAVLACVESKTETHEKRNETHLEFNPSPASF